jgi:hypothetical protein
MVVAGQTGLPHTSSALSKEIDLELPVMLAKSLTLDALSRYDPELTDISIPSEALRSYSNGNTCIIFDQKDYFIGRVSGRIYFQNGQEGPTTITAIVYNRYSYPVLGDLYTNSSGCKKRRSFRTGGIAGEFKTVLLESVDLPNGNISVPFDFVIENLEGMLPTCDVIFEFLKMNSLDFLGNFMRANSKKLGTLYLKNYIYVFTKINNYWKMIDIF